MKRMYWRPQRVSRTVLLLISIASVAGFVGVEKYKRKVKQPYYAEKIAAAKIAQEAFKVLQDERVKRKIPIDKGTDPAQSGLIGEQITPVTTNSGGQTAAGIQNSSSSSEPAGRRQQLPTGSRRLSLTSNIA